MFLTVFSRDIEKLIIACKGGTTADDYHDNLNRRRHDLLVPASIWKNI